MIYTVLIIVIIVIAVVANNNKKKRLSMTTKPTNGRNGNSGQGGQQFFSGDYWPQNIQRTGLQVLETIHIIGTSKAIDTIKGRYDFLVQIVGILQKGQDHSN